MSQAVMMASRLFPAAVVADVAKLPSVVTFAGVATFASVVTFARNAPRAIAGHTRVPHNNRAASARPLGGHTGLALGCSEANARPAFASPKYANANSAHPTRSRRS